MQGTWLLQSRIDRNEQGEIVPDPILGTDPLAILVYANGHFAAQFMKRDRSESSLTQATQAGENNTAAVGGYDAYFGTYKTCDGTNEVAHTLLASINPANTGKTFYRTLEVKNDTLEIVLNTTSFEGEPVTRTLTWKKIS